MHRFAVKGHEIDRFFQETEGDRRSVHLEKNRVPYVGDGDAVPYGGCTEGLPGKQDLEEKVGIDLGREIQQRDHITEDCRGIFTL